MMQSPNKAPLLRHLCLIQPLYLLVVVVLEHPVVSQTGTSVVIAGDHTATQFYIGEKYMMTYEFSELPLKEPILQVVE